ncbi:MAG: hypothetical protein K2X03_27440 [Bryobacteraceae bacterium]|nr:hypothetical protein [Bryobacteraceae bacterium]
MSQPAIEGTPMTNSYYTWAPEGKGVQVRLEFDVIDRLSAEVMRGFGSVPKRGAEVGGILLGEVVTESPLLVHIRDFSIVSCDYRRGPSFQLTEADTRLFAETVEKATQSNARDLRPVGYFRSHTRDGMGLTDEDLQLFSNYFPDPTGMVLLIRPFATKVSQAGFFFEEKGQIRSDAPYLTFPFRRRELGGGSVGDSPRAADLALPELPEEPAATKAPIPIRESRPADLAPMAKAILPPSHLPPSQTETRPLFGAQTEVAPVYTPSSLTPRDTSTELTYSTEASQKIKKSWVWLPLSSIFLLLGVLVGFLIAVNIRKPNTAVPLTAYGLSLAVRQEADSIHVTWDRGAIPVAIATRGILHIQDGEFYKAVELKPADLQTGSVIIRNARANVTLRLEVFLLDRNSISEVYVVKTVN